MNQHALLFFLRGQGLKFAVIVFAFGLIYRMLHPILLGRKRNLAAPRGSEWGPGVRTIWRRSFFPVRLTPRGHFIIIAGYIFHLGFLITLLFLSQHIELVKNTFGITWPALPPGAITIAAVLSVAAMAALLVHRITDPVKRLISDFQDYLVWVLTLLPLLTGLTLDMAADYQRMLVMHMISVELLLIAIPFTKLAHMLTTFSSRWYNGAIAGYKGVKA